MMVARGSCKWDPYLFLCFPFPPFLLPSSLISSSLSRDPPFLAPSPLSTSSPPFFVLFSFGPAHYPSFLVLHMLQVFHVRTFWSFFHFSVSIVTESMVKAPTSVFRLVHRFSCQCFDNLSLLINCSFKHYCFSIFRCSTVFRFIVLPNVRSFVLVRVFNVFLSFHSFPALFCPFRPASASFLQPRCPGTAGGLQHQTNTDECENMWMETRCWIYDRTIIDAQSQ